MIKMARILIVAYRPAPGKRDALLALLEQQHRRARQLNLISQPTPWLGEGGRGEILYVVGLDTSASVDALWEDEVYQDIDANIAAVATMTPLRTLDEANAAYLNIAALPLRGVEAGSGK